MFCRKCKPTADKLSSAHKPTQRYRSERFRPEIQSTKTKISTNRFFLEADYPITVQITQYHAQDLIKAALRKMPLEYGDYDQVIFIWASGSQQFGSLATGYNRTRNHTVEVNYVEIFFFLEQSDTMREDVITALNETYPYEELVVYGQNCLRTLHIRGTDSDDPNRFWDR